MTYSHTCAILKMLPMREAKRKGYTTVNNMLNIFLEGSSKPIIKFERFEQGKALDWITQKGYYIVHKEAIPYLYWIVKPLP